MADSSPAVSKGKFNKDTRQKKRIKSSKAQLPSASLQQSAIQPGSQPVGTQASFNGPSRNRQAFQESVDDDQVQDQAIEETDQQAIKRIYDQQLKTKRRLISQRQLRFQAVSKQKGLTNKLKTASRFYKGAKIGTSVTIAGAVVTVLIMLWQLFLSGVSFGKGGKLFRGAGGKYSEMLIPPLSIFEFIILLLLMVIVALIIVLFIYIFYVVSICADSKLRCIREFRGVLWPLRELLWSLWAS